MSANNPLEGNPRQLEEEQARETVKKAVNLIEQTGDEPLANALRQINPPFIVLDTDSPERSVARLVFFGFPLETDVKIKIDRGLLEIDLSAPDGTRELYFSGQNEVILYSSDLAYPKISSFTYLSDGHFLGGVLLMCVLPRKLKNP